MTEDEKGKQTDAKPEVDVELQSDVPSLLREIERLKSRVKLREDQLEQAIVIANRANDERTARREAEKESLVHSIQMDGKFAKEELEKKSLDELNTIRMTLDRSLEKTFANVAADMEEQKRKKQPLLTAGYYDRATDSWKGGV